MISNHPINKTDAFFMACEQRNLSEIMRLLDDKEVNIYTQNEEGMDFISLICLTPNRSEDSLFQILENVLNHPKINGNKKMLRGQGLSEVNIVDLLNGKFPKHTPKLSGVDRITNMVNQALKGEKVSMVKTSNSQEKPTILKEPFLKNKTVQKFVAAGLLLATVCGAGALHYTDKINLFGNSDNKQEQVIDEVNRADLQNLADAGIIAFDKDSEIVFNPQHIYFDVTEQKPDLSGIDFNNDIDAPGLFTGNQVEKIFENLAKEENRKFWGAANSFLNKAREKGGNINIVVLKENSPENMEKLVGSPENNTNIYINDMGRFEKLGSAIDHDVESFVAYSTIYTIFNHYIQDNSPELNKAIENNSINMVNANMVSFMYSSGMAGLYLTDNENNKGVNLALEGLHKDAFNDPKMSLSPFINAISWAKDKGASDQELLHAGMYGAKRFSTGSKDTHRSTHAITNEEEVTLSYYQMILDNVELVDNYVMTGETLTMEELIKLYPQDIQKNLSNFTSKNLADMVKFVGVLPNVNYEHNTTEKANNLSWYYNTEGERIIHEHAKKYEKSNPQLHEELGLKKVEGPRTYDWKTLQPIFNEVGEEYVKDFNKLLKAGEITNTLPADVKIEDSSNASVNIINNFVNANKGKS